MNKILNEIFNDPEKLLEFVQLLNRHMEHYDKDINHAMDRSERFEWDAIKSGII